MSGCYENYRTLWEEIVSIFECEIQCDVRCGHHYIYRAISVFLTEVVVKQSRLLLFGKSIEFEIFRIVFDRCRWGCSQRVLESLIKVDVPRIVFVVPVQDENFPCS